MKNKDEATPTPFKTRIANVCGNIFLIFKFLDQEVQHFCFSRVSFIKFKKFNNTSK